jgi:hypothetical protein
MYDDRDSNPYYQSADLDFDAARAEWERQGEGEMAQKPPETDWNAVEENMALITGIERAVRTLMETLSPQIREALGWATPPRPTDTPESVARAAIAAYREYTERYGQSPDEATEAAVHEVTEGLAVDVDAIRAELAAQPGPTPEEMKEWPL